MMMDAWYCLSLTSMMMVSAYSPHFLRFRFGNGVMGIGLGARISSLSPSSVSFVTRSSAEC